MQQISIMQLILHASIVVQLVIVILLLLSIISWGIILNKTLIFIHAKYVTNKFIKNYHHSSSMFNLYNTLGVTPRTVEALFYNSINEYNRLIKQNINDKEVIINNIERTLISSIDSEINYYENKLSLLATFGSVSPYIGLLGTVWGIMHAFIGLSNQAQATITSVAPGIAEALIATAIGLFVAIPAYIFYNKFTNEIAKLHNKMNSFSDEFLNLLNRKLNSNDSILK